MTSIYRVVFRHRAKKRFDKLDRAIQRQISNKLDERRKNPRVPGDALSKMRDCYKIKLRSSGIRLIYRVEDDRLVLLVIGVGGREREEAYRLAADELAKLDD